MVPAARPTDRFQPYFTPVLAIAYQALGDAALAADAAEACFVRLSRRRNAGPLDVWRTLVEVLRRFIARGAYVALLGSNANRWQASLLDALAELSPDDRILLLLHYHEHLTFEQLAVVMDDKVDAVRAAVSEARKQLLDSTGLGDALH